MTKAAKKKPIEQTWPAARVDLWPIDRIKPYPNNPRTHTPEQVRMIAASMIEDGVTAPILVDEKGVVIYGHGRLQAALQNGFKKYPVAVARGLSEAKKRALRIKDNSLALLAGWDTELMKIEVGALKMEGYDVGLLGFGEAQLVSFTTTPGPPGEFPEFDEDIDTEHTCPKCGYRFSGGKVSPKNGGDE